jgi:aryl-alcohol dehydrogenase-like predicted oxidoreductase
VKLKYRVLGRTGLKVSELGFGGHEYRRPLPTTLGRWGEIDLEKFSQTQSARNRLIKEAIGAGVNFFDATQPEETKSLGLALKELGVKNDIHVAIMILTPFSKMSKTPKSKWRQIIRDDVEKSLQLLQADYADLLNMHMPERDYSQQRLTAALEVLQELKEEGKIGFIGSSSHQPRLLGELMRKYDCFDSVMIRYNYHLQEARDVIFPLAKTLEVGVVVMKPLAWPYYGIPFTRFNPGDGGSYTPAQHALRWILNSSEVSTVVPGMNSQEELEENVAAIIKEGNADERLLERYLQTALGSQAREKLTNMLRNPDADICYFAERALTDLNLKTGK